MKISQRPYTSYDDAKNMIPEIKRTLIRIQQLNNYVQQNLDTIKASHIKLEDDFKDLSKYDEDSIDTISSLKIMLSTVQDEIDLLKSNGCFLTNIEQGVVHWYSKFNEQEIILSWKQGETEECHWHLSKQDFNNREPYQSIYKLEKDTETS